MRYAATLKKCVQCVCSNVEFTLLFLLENSEKFCIMLVCTLSSWLLFTAYYRECRNTCSQEGEIYRELHNLHILWY